MNKLLKELTESVGVSGAEKEVRELIKSKIEEHVDEWRVDNVGNLIVTKKGTTESDLRVMVDAHMDEVGLMNHRSGYIRKGEIYEGWGDK